MANATVAPAAYAGAMLHSDDGQGLAEYAVILALVALVAIAGLRALGPLPGKGITPAAQALSK